MTNASNFIIWMYIAAPTVFDIIVCICAFLAIMMQSACSIDDDVSATASLMVMVMMVFRSL